MQLIDLILGDLKFARAPKPSLAQLESLRLEHARKPPASFNELEVFRQATQDVLDAQRGAFGENIPSPTGSELKSPYGFDSPEKEKALIESTPTGEYFTQVMSWARGPAPPTEVQANAAVRAAYLGAEREA